MACKKGTMIEEALAQYPANWKWIQNGSILVEEREKINTDALNSSWSLFSTEFCKLQTSCDFFSPSEKQQPAPEQLDEARKATSSCSTLQILHKIAEKSPRIWVSSKMLLYLLFLFISGWIMESVVPSPCTLILGLKPYTTTTKFET